MCWICRNSTQIVWTLNELALDLRILGIENLKSKIIETFIDDLEIYQYAFEGAKLARLAKLVEAVLW